MKVPISWTQVWIPSVPIRLTPTPTPKPPLKIILDKSNQREVVSARR